MLSNMNFEQSRGAKVLANRKEGYEHYCWKINLSFTAFDELFAYFYVTPKYKLPYFYVGTQAGVDYLKELNS